MKETEHITIANIFAATCKQEKGRNEKEQYEKGYKRRLDGFSYINRPLFLRTLPLHHDPVRDIVRTIDPHVGTPFRLIKSEYKFIRSGFDDHPFREGLEGLYPIYLKGKADPSLTLNNLKSFSSQIASKNFIGASFLSSPSLISPPSFATKLISAKRIIPSGIVSRGRFSHGH